MLKLPVELLMAVIARSGVPAAVVVAAAAVDVTVDVVKPVHEVVEAVVVVAAAAVATAVIVLFGWTNMVHLLERISV